jgi:putative oxygen-independent coproporphyrinogen III oxidase
MTHFLIKIVGKEEFLKIPTPTIGDISLYFHLPFCKKKCHYCHFFVIKDDESKQEALFKALINEVSQKKNLLENKKIVSIYFGGGTPYLFKTKFFKEIIQKIYTLKAKIASEIEITIETNPEDINIEKVKALKDIGINRFSVGIQTLDNKLLQILGRSHDRLKILNSLDMIHHSGIKNVSIDLMYEIPYQSTDSWYKTLSYIPSMTMNHISLYNLTIEPNTAFFRQKDKLIKMKPSDKIAKKMLIKAIETFDANNFKRYEISAFAKNSSFSMHNIGYWLYRPFIGYGPSAFSYYNGIRSQNVCNFEKYIQLINQQKNAQDFIDDVSYSKKVKEALAVSLRLIEGIDINDFEKKWGKIPSDLEVVLNNLCQSNHLIRFKNRIKLSSLGLLFYDSIATEII